MSTKKSNRKMVLNFKVKCTEQEFYYIYSMIGGLANGEKFQPGSENVIINSDEYKAGTAFFNAMNEIATEKMKENFVVELEATLRAFKNNPIQVDRAISGMLDIKEETTTEMDNIENELKIVTDQTNSVKKCKDCGTPLKKNEKVYCFDCL